MVDFMVTLDRERFTTTIGTSLLIGSVVAALQNAD